MEVREIQNKKTEVVVDILCDCCGKSCKVYEGVIDNPGRIDVGERSFDFEFMKMEATWGYHSDKDTQKWSAQICEKCVDEKFSSIKFKKENYL